MDLSDRSVARPSALRVECARQPGGLRPAIDAARRACLGDFDGREASKRGSETFPNPGGEDFARRILKPGNFVEIPMIELVMERSPRTSEIGKVTHPSFRLCE